MTDTTPKTDTHSDRIAPRSPTAIDSRSFEWSAGPGTTKTALFRIYPTQAVLQHVRTVTVSQRTASTCEIDTDAGLDDLPQFVLDELQTTGRDVTAERDRLSPPATDTTSGPPTITFSEILTGSTSEDTITTDLVDQTTQRAILDPDRTGRNRRKHQLGVSS